MVNKNSNIKFVQKKESYTSLKEFSFVSIIMVAMVYYHFLNYLTITGLRTLEEGARIMLKL